MPRVNLMSWEPARSRWVKMYKGVRYIVTCEELGGAAAMVRTQEGSRQLANLWWETKLAEISAPGPVERILAEVDKVKPSELKGMIERGQAAMRIMQAGGIFNKEGVEDILGFPVADENTRAEYLGQVVAPILNRPQVAPDRKLNHHVERFVLSRQDQARAGTRSSDGADNIRICLSHFVKFVGPETAVEAVSSTVWTAWYDHCQAMIAKRDRDSRGKDGWSVDYAAKTFGTSKTFMTSLFESEILAVLPRSVNSKKHRFSRPEKDPVTFTKAEVSTLLKRATGQHRLHLLLMLNTGCTQGDISHMKKSQIDLERGYIARRRSKTERLKSSVKVRYKLWPETLELLRQHLSEDPVHALMTQSGRPWVRKELEGSGRLKKSDNVATLFQHLRRKTGVTKSLKIFRKTSATALKSSKSYRDLRHYFLGHSPRTVADRHYSRESQKLMNKAVMWLRKVFIAPEDKT